MSSGLTPKPTVYFPLVLVCFPMRSFNCKPDRTLFNYSAILQFKWKQGNTIVTVSNTSDFWLLSLINIQCTILGESDHQNQRLCPRILHLITKFMHIKARGTLTERKCAAFFILDAMAFDFPAFIIIITQEFWKAFAMLLVLQIAEHQGLPSCTRFLAFCQQFSIF